MLEPTIAILSRLIAFPTVSNESNRELADYAASILSTAGFGVRTTTNPEQTKINIFATFGPETDGGVVLSGHTDVVPAEGQQWTHDPFVAHVEDGRVWGRGSADMKGFIACVLALAPTMPTTHLRRPLHVALTYDEEEGCHGAKVMLEDLVRSGRRPGTVIIGEPTALTVVSAHKGCYEFTTEIGGVEQHASAGDAGGGAIHAAARFIRMLDSLQADLTARPPADSPFSPPGATINVGTITGGVARNITAGSTRLEWELRSVDDDDLAFVTERVASFVEEELLPQMRRIYPEAKVSTTTVGAVGPFQPKHYSAAVALAQRLTGTATTEVVSFGTEAGLFQAAGIPAVVCGPGRIEQAHRPDEYIEIAQLESCLAMLTNLLDEMSA